MFHARHFLLAARPRASTARRLALFLLVVLSLAAGAPFAAAEMVYYTEDFFHDGEPGFDPMFNHAIVEPGGYPDYMYPMWRIHPPTPGYIEQYRLVLAFGTKDVITFNLPEGQIVASATVVVAPEMNSLGYVKFIGTRGEWETSEDQYGQQRFEASYEELGYIQAIELSARQAITFTTVTIGVVPEPTLSLLVVCAFSCVLWLRSRDREAEPR